MQQKCKHSFNFIFQPFFNKFFQNAQLFAIHLGENIFLKVSEKLYLDI